MGDKTKIGMDVGHKDNNPLNNDLDNLKNEDPSDNRREPRLRVKEILGKDADQGDYIDDFQKSDAPQFKGKSQEKRKKMAIAAFLSKNEEVKLPKDDLNWVKTGGSFGKKRRFPTYVVKKEGNKYKAYDEQNKMSFKAASNSLEGLAKLLKPYIEKRTGSWKFEEVKQDKDIKDKEGTQPSKYYAGGMAKSTKDKRATHFKKKKEGPAPGDASAETKPSVHTKKFKQMFGETVLDEKIEALVNKSEKSGISYGILKKVYDRGMAAYKTGHRPGTTSQQWALARVNSFITKGKGTWGKADADLAKQVEMIEQINRNDWDEITEKSEYKGKSVELNNPTKGDIKKYKVYVRNDKGNVVKVEFGDPNMEIKRDDPARRAAFRARHNCDQKKDKTTAGYWSCKFWSSKSVTDLMKG